MRGTPYKTGWAYNQAGLPVSMTYPGGETLAYDYNPRMLLEKVHDTMGTPGTTTDDYYYVMSTSYDVAGRMTQRLLGNGLTQANVYNPWTTYGGRLGSITAGVWTGQGFSSTVQNLGYTYDPVGNVKTITDYQNSNQRQCFQYDALDRLTKATTWNDAGQNCTAQQGQGNYDETYDYSSTTGNLSNKAGVTLNYNDTAHAHAVSSTSSGNTYAYDANGNMTQRVIGGQTYSLGYDAEGHLVSVTSPSMSASFVYDGDGARVKSTINGVVTTFVGNHYEKTGSTVTKYYHAGGSRVAVKQGSTLYYLLSDHLGSTSLTTDASGAVVASMLYKAWGETRYSSGTTPTKYTFQGQYSNVADFGLQYFNARWYDGSLGRWAQPDTDVPASQGVQGLDRYAFVNNNPIRYTDPSGHYVCPDSGCLRGPTIQSFLFRFGVVLTNGSAQWDKRDSLAALTAIVDAGRRMAAASGKTAIEAFRTAFRTYDRNLELRKMISYQYTDSQTGELKTAYDGGQTQNSHLIFITRLAQPGGVRSASLAFGIARNNIVHELAHAFRAANPSVGSNIPGSLISDEGWPAPVDGGQYLWRQHPCSVDPQCLSSEVYADMFLGWVYNTWGSDQRLEYMTTDMSDFWSGQK